MIRTALSKSTGFSLLEVLITLVIISVGMLGLAGLQSRAQQAELESYQRAQALILMQDMVNRINTNRDAASCYAISSEIDEDTGAWSWNGNYLGSGGVDPAPCASYGTTATREIADADLDEWKDLLLGSSETLDGSNVGAMVGARGCIAYDGTTYTVSVAWQGLTPTTAPTDQCGSGEYGNENLRRVVNTSIRIADLD